MPKQTKFSNSGIFFGNRSHGGVASIGRRKMRRPLSIDKPLYLVLDSAQGDARYSLEANAHGRSAKGILLRQAKKFGVSILHLHSSRTQLELVVRIQSRLGFQQFLRSATALIARKVSGARKGHAFGKFWRALAFSRVLKSRVNLRKFFRAAGRFLAAASPGIPMQKSCRNSP